MDPANTAPEDGERRTRKAVEGSRVVTAARTVEAWLERSFLYQLVTGVGESDAVGGSGSSLLDGSGLVGGARRVGEWTRQSFLYRWLTKEPDPDVIVIDLRETLFVGPVIRILDRSIAWFAPRWRSSGLKRLSERASARVADRPVRAFGVVLMAAVATRSVILAVGGGLSAGSVLLSLFLLGVGFLAIRSEHSPTDLQETRTYQLLIAIFEPPPPDEKRMDNQDDETE